MDEIKFLKSFVFSALGLGAYFALQYYVFDNDEIDVWAVAFIPLGREIFKLAWKYYQVWEKRNEQGLVTLKESRFEPSDIVWVVLMMIFVFYFRKDLILFLIPLAILNIYLLYMVKKNQRYHFGDWSIENLTDGDDISARNITSIEYKSNRLEIHYVENEYDDEDDEDNQNVLSIERTDLHAPRSWYEFEKIVQKFEQDLKAKRAENHQKTAILDSK